MKLRARVLWSLLALLFAATSAEAILLDAPHNVENGIYCYDCHSADPGDGQNLWDQQPDGTDPDVTTYNWVCNRCHSATPSDLTHQGPLKKLHNATNTNSSRANWSTECIDCHDPHFQSQKDWSVGADNIYVAVGVYATGLPGGAIAYDDTDVYDFGTNPTGQGGPLGTTTVGFTVSGTPGIDPLDWDNKGKGAEHALRATDNSRGLIIVSNTADELSSRTYEVVDVQAVAGGYVMKLNGDASGLGILANGQGFGVLYGSSIRSEVRTPTGNKEVKFFRPENFTDSYGGSIDLSPVPSDTEPLVGLCQVCHTATSHFNNNVDQLPAAGYLHNETGVCGSCHDPIDGFPPSADHTAFITSEGSTPVGTYNCGQCHANIVAHPESGHPLCSNCHASTNPVVIGATPLSLVGAAGNVDTGANVYSALTDQSRYSWDASTGRLLDTQATPLFVSDVGFTKILCSECHDQKPAALENGNHGGHPLGTFGFGTAGCEDCHNTTMYGGTADIVQDIHGGTCTVCHNDAAVAVSDYTQRDIGSSLNDVDGDARDAVATPGASVCVDCHGTAIAANSLGAIHHDNANKFFTGGGTECVVCHTGLLHAGDHTTMVADVAPCGSCHTATAGSADNVPVDATTGKPGDLVHDACSQCHVQDVNDIMGLVTPSGSVTTMNNPVGTATNDGGGVCTACHTTYFVGHLHATTHAINAIVAPCNGCHTAVAAPFIASGDVHYNGGNGCANCHDLDATPTGALIGSAINSPTGGNCTDCHLGYFDSHDHGVMNSIDAGSAEHAITATVSCAACHDTVEGGDTSNVNAKNAVSAPYVGTGEVHSTLGCMTCHDATNGGPKAASSAANWGTGTWASLATGDCVVCHTTGWDALHSGKSQNIHETVRSIVTADINCTVCHDGNPGINTTAPNAVTSPYTGATEVHNTNSCSTCHDAAGQLKTGTIATLTVNGGNCSTCHTGYPAGHAHPHNFTVSAGCSSCHNADKTTDGSNAGNAVDANNPWTATDEVHAVGCTLCHDFATPALLTLAAGKLNGSECITCHATTWVAIHTADLGVGAAFVDHSANRVTADTNCTGCHSNTGNGRNTSVTPYIAAGDVHNTTDGGNGCLACHTGANDGGFNTPVNAFQIVAGNCSNCHTGTGKTWTSIHTASNTVDHSQEVAVLTGCTDSCHLTTAGVAGNTAALVDVTDGTDVHDACASCHDANGNRLASVAIPGSTTSPKAIPAGGGNCGVCHDAQTFESHVHGQDGGYVDHTVTNTVADIGQGSANCNTCHSGSDTDASGTNFDSWTDILGKHTDCAMCHSYTTNQTGDPNTPVVSTVTSVISNGGAVTCITCHTVKGPTTYASHGGHSPTDFGWDGTCGTCHSGADIVADVHGVTGPGVRGCGLCHVNTNGGGALKDNAANAADADPWQATVAVVGGPGTASVCSTCHNVTFARDIGEMHHTNESTVNTYSVATSCENCHTAVVHTNMIKDNATPDCINCHTGTAAQAGVNPPLSGTLGDPKVHDACTSCHTFDGTNNGILITTDATGNKGLPVSTALPNGGSDAAIVGNDGGGVCVICHTGDKKAMHHGSSLATAGTCQACHDGTTATGVDGAVAPSQLACQVCHVNLNPADANVVKVYSLRLGNASGLKPTSITAGARTGVDANGVVTSHTVAQTAAAGQVNDYRACFACHGGTRYTGAAGVQSTVVAPFHGYPGDAAKNLLVHQYTDGAIRTTAITRKTMLAGGTNSGTMAIDETNGNALPLVFQYFHPGHNNFRRFSVVRTNGNTPTSGRPDALSATVDTTRRGFGASNNANNAEFYWTADMNLTTVAGTATRSVMITGTVPASWVSSPPVAPVWWTGAAATTTEIEEGGNPFGANGNGAGFGTQWEALGTTWNGRTVSYTWTAPYTRFGTTGGYGSTAMIPTLPALAAPADRVWVNSAEFNASNQLVVVAGNDLGCSELLLTGYTIASGNTGNPPCTLVSTATTYPGTGQVTVDSTDAAATAVTIDVVNNSSTPTTVNITSGPHSWTPTAVGIGSVTAVTATSADSVTGMYLNYNSSNYAMTNGGGGTSWSYTLTGVPYATPLKAVVNDATYSGESATQAVTNNGDVITVTSASYTGTTFAVSLTTSRVNTSVSIDYNNDGATTADLAMTNAGGGTSWTYSGTEAAFSSPVYIYTSTFGETNAVVTNNNNAAPTLTVSAPTTTTVDQGAGVTVTYNLADADSVATVSFYYDIDGIPGNVDDVAAAGCASQPESGTGTCTWDTSLVPAAGAIYKVFGAAADGSNPTVYAYAPGAVTVNTPPACGNLVASAWVNHYTGTTLPASAGPYTATYPAGTSRLLVVGVYGFNGTPYTSTISNVALGAAGFTEIYQNNAVSNRNHGWVGYMGETAIAANNGSNITMSVTGNTSTSSAVLTKEFQYVSQPQPILDFSSNTNNTTTAIAPFATAAAISYGDKDMVIGLGADRNAAVTWTAPAGAVSQQAGGGFYSAMAVPAMTGTGTVQPAISNSRYGFIVGATVQSECNNP